MWPGHSGGAFSTVQVHEGRPSSALTSALANNEASVEQNQSSGLQPLHKCTFCGAAYRYRCRLLRHTTAMHGGTRFVCPQCQCTLASRRGLTEHVKIVHQKLAIYQCQHCGKGYSHRSNYSTISQLTLASNETALGKITFVTNEMSVRCARGIIRLGIA